MPSQLYGNIAEEDEKAAGGIEPLVQPGQEEGGLGIAGSQEQANSPYANFEDIYNQNSNYAKKSAQDLRDKTVKPLNDIKAGTGGSSQSNMGNMFAQGKPGGSGGATLSQGGLAGRIEGAQSLAPEGHAESLGLTAAGTNPSVLGTFGAQPPIQPTAGTNNSLLQLQQTATSQQPAQAAGGSVPGGGVVGGAGNTKLGGGAQAPQAPTAGLSTGVLGTFGQQPAPVSQSYANTAAPEPVKDGVIDPNDPYDPDNPFAVEGSKDPTIKDGVIDQNDPYDPDNPFALPRPPDGGASPDPVPGTDGTVPDAPTQPAHNYGGDQDFSPADTNHDGRVSDLEQFRFEQGVKNGEINADGSKVIPASELAEAQQQAEIDAGKKKYGEDLTAAELRAKEEAAREDAELEALIGMNDDLASYENDEGLALMQESDPDATVWDAALQAQGGGRDYFDELEKQYKGKDEEAWKKIAAKRKEREEELKGLREGKDYWDNAKVNDMSHLDKTKTGTGTGTGRYGSYGEVMGGDAHTGLHSLALSLSPADQGLVASGRAGGYKGPVVAEYFRNAVNMGADLDRENFKLAMQEIKNDWGEELAIWAYENIPDALYAEAAGANFGYINYLISQLLRNSGKKPRSEMTDQERYIEEWERMHPGRKYPGAK